MRQVVKQSRCTLRPQLERHQVRDEAGSEESGSPSKQMLHCSSKGRRRTWVRGQGGLRRCGGDGAVELGDDVDVDVDTGLDRDCMNDVRFATIAGVTAGNGEEGTDSVDKEAVRDALDVRGSASTARRVDQLDELSDRVDGALDK